MTSDFPESLGEAQEALFASLAGPPVCDPLEAEITQLALAAACGVTRQTVHAWTSEKGLQRFGEGYKVRDALAWLTAERQRRIESTPQAVEAAEESALARDDLSLKAQKTQAEIELKRLDVERKKFEAEVLAGKYVLLDPLRDQWTLYAATLRKRMEAVGKSFDCLQHIRQAIEEVERDVRASLANATQTGKGGADDEENDGNAATAGL